MEVSKCCLHRRMRYAVPALSRFINMKIENCVERWKIAVCHKKIYFRSSMQLIFLLEEMYDELNFPQATTETRSFISIQTNYLLTKQKVQQLRDQAAAARAQEKQAVLEQTGLEEGIPLATFILSLQYRANSSWQGNISWKKMNYTVQFRSLLELLHLLDEALLLVQSSGGSVEFGRMLKGYADASKQEAE